MYTIDVFQRLTCPFNELFSYVYWKSFWLKGFRQLHIFGIVFDESLSTSFRVFANRSRLGADWFGDYVLTTETQTDMSTSCNMLTRFSPLDK